MVKAKYGGHWFLYLYIADGPICISSSVPVLLYCLFTICRSLITMPIRICWRNTQLLDTSL